MISSSSTAEVEFSAPTVSTNKSLWHKLYYYISQSVSIYDANMSIGVNLSQYNKQGETSANNLIRFLKRRKIYCEIECS